MFKLNLKIETIKKHKAYVKNNFNIEKIKKADFTNKNITTIKNIDSLDSELRKECTKRRLEEENKQFANYCDRNKEIIAIATFKELEEIHNEIITEYPFIKILIQKNIKIGKPAKQYWKYVVEAFGYDNFINRDVQSLLKDKTEIELTQYNFDKKLYADKWNAYMFVLESEARTCPYCNKQYITPILTSNGKMRADIDHFLPKSKYPYFSMSLYNLIPVCHSCNSSLKGTKEFDFNYINPYEESIDDYIKFRADIRPNGCTHIDLVNRNKDLGNKELKKYTNTFKLELQYNYHTNVVDDLIFKRKAYSETYIEDLSRQMHISKQNIRERLVGYTEEALKINNEPLSKLKRDIAIQLGFFQEDYSELIKDLEKIMYDEKES